MSWPTEALGSLFDIARGGSPRPINDFLTDDPDGINWIMIGDTVENEKFISSTKKRIVQDGVRRSRMVYPGDFLLTNSMSFGRPYILKTQGCIHDGWLVLSPKANNADHNFFYHLLGSGFVHSKFKQKAAGAVVKNLNIDLVKSVKIPLPPLAEQKRIAAILDKADAIRRKRRRALELADEFLRSVFLDMFGDPVANPMGWEVRPLGEIATFSGGGTPSKQNKSFYSGNICWATSKDIKDDELFDTQDHITQEAISSSATKLVPKGTLLIVVKSKILMRKVPLAIAMVETCFNQDLKAISTGDEAQNRYILRHMKIAEKVLLGLARGVNTEGLTLEHLRNLKIMCPPEDKRLQFSRIEQHLKKRFKLLQANSTQSETLFASLSQRAFRGEL